MEFTVLTLPTKMKPEIKAAWLTKLRDPNFKQGQMFLRSGADNYCCLGLLCQVYIEMTGKGGWEQLNGESNYSFLLEDGLETQVLPYEVLEWVGGGLINTTGDFGLKLPPKSEGALHTEVHLTHLNDGFGEVKAISFVEIADIIEKHL